MTSPTYVLGLNCNIHQSAVAIIKDGVLVAGVEEERFTRIKYDSNFPINALEYCLKEAGITLKDVSYVGFYWQPWKGLIKRIWWLIRYFPRSLQTFQGGEGKEWRGSAWTLFKHLSVHKQLKQLGFRGKFHYIDHHMAHAASAFFVSPFKRAAIVTTDFCGEDCTTLLGVGEGNTIHAIKRSYLPHSLGLFYGALTQYLGYNIHADEYRVMGLAPYGKPLYTKLFESMVAFKNGAVRVDNSWFAFHEGGKYAFSKRWERELGPVCTSEEEVETGNYKHYAASGQEVLNKVFLDIGKFLKDKTGEENLCMAGGVALNSVSNGVLARSGFFKHIWVQPAAYDPGCALGVCFYIWHQMLEKPRAFVMEHAYWGPEYTEEEMRASAKKHSLSFERHEHIEKEVAKLLADGKVIGWYQGRIEWGPRSLGHRSILADPRRAEMKEVINQKVKFREPYRPFAPSVLEEDVGRYFEWSGPSPYMLFVCPVREDAREKIPAVTHIDNSARIQTVSKKTNPRYWSLINEFKKITGESVVLNTSFNVKGEPIVCTPEEAVRCFLNTDIDYLVMGNLLCTKSTFDT